MDIISDWMDEGLVVLYTDRMHEVPGLTGASLEEGTTGEGVLNLEFAGWGPVWLRYMCQVSLYHAGKAVFHGKVTRVSRANDGGSRTTRAEVHNFMWLLERQTLGQQLAEILESDEGSGSGSGTGGGKDAAFHPMPMQRVGKGQVGKYEAQKIPGGGYWVSWGMALGNMRTVAPGWYISLPSGRSRAAASSGELCVVCSAGVAGRQSWAVTEKMVTTASALWRMRRKAADVQYIVDYDAGTVTATGIGELPRLVVDTGDGGVLSVSDIEEQEAERVRGVVIAWTNDIGQTEVHRWPPELDEAADGVKVFSLSGTYYVASWDTVAREYYEAANVRQFSGSVSFLARKLTVSPLGRRLCLTGAGTHESWRDMDAVVTRCNWDLMAGTVEVTLGREFSDPAFSDAAETEDGGDYVEAFEKNMSYEAANRWPFLANNGSDGGGGGGGGWGSASAESKYRVEQVSLREPDGCAPGMNGWEETWRGLLWTGSTTQYVHRRQLMRFDEDGGKVVLQVALQDEVNGTWEVAS